MRPRQWSPTNRTLSSSHAIQIDVFSQVQSTLIWDGLITHIKYTSLSVLLILLDSHLSHSSVLPSLSSSAWNLLSSMQSNGDSSICGKCVRWTHYKRHSRCISSFPSSWGRRRSGTRVSSRSSYSNSFGIIWKIPPFSLALSNILQ